jgi:uncharacterized membrane protein
MTEENAAGASRPAKIVGFAVFFVGAVLLCLTFLLSYRLFHSPDLIGSADSAPGHTASVKQSLAAAGVRVVMLFVMAYVASLLSSKGIQLYAAARGGAAGPSKKQ